jgi:CheY-like chemotaxis protein
MAAVLLVEDDETMRRMYAFGLQQEGFEVAIAASGGEALMRMDERHYDIIVLDMMLTGMSGLDFLNSYDIKTKSPGTQVVALTNLDNPVVAGKVMAKGVAAYLRKADYEPAALAAYLKTLAPNPAQT